jgi:hypothetical protein
MAGYRVLLCDKEDDEPTFYAVVNSATNKKFALCYTEPAAQRLATLLTADDEYCSLLLKVCRG